MVWYRYLFQTILCMEPLPTVPNSLLDDKMLPVLVPVRMSMQKLYRLYTGRFRTWYLQGPVHTGTIHVPYVGRYRYRYVP